MIITFCGHSHFLGSAEREGEILALLERLVGDNEAELFLGGYGNFDEFAYACSKKFKERHPKVSLVFVTPYLTLDYQKNHLEYKSRIYDSILYPEIEGKPLRFAITYRNRYMVEQADYIIAYIAHSSGGAYRTFKYAKKLGKEIYNIGSLSE